MSDGAMQNEAQSHWEALKVRFGDPFLSSLALSFVAVNWPALYILLNHSGPPVVAIGAAWHWWATWGDPSAPVALALGYTLGYPWVRLVFVALREFAASFTENVVELVTRRVRWMDVATLYNHPDWIALKNAESGLQSNLTTAWNMVALAQGVQPGATADVFQLDAVDVPRIKLPALLMADMKRKRVRRRLLAPPKPGDGTFVVAFAQITRDQYVCASPNSFLFCDWPDGVKTLYYEQGAFRPLPGDGDGGHFRIDRVGESPLGKFFIV